MRQTSWQQPHTGTSEPPGRSLGQVSLSGEEGGHREVNKRIEKEGSARVGFDHPPSEVAHRLASERRTVDERLLLPFQLTCVLPQTERDM